MNGRIGIVLGGWAPAMTLMSGAMLGFNDAGLEFEVISTAGVGALVGLLALAPKHGRPMEALAELPNLYVSDILYAALPINFKVFHKFGPFAQPMHELRNRVPRIRLDPKAASPFARLLNDWVDLAFCAMTPSTFEPKSAGLMSPGPEIDELVDFTALPGAAARFYLNAFNLDERTLEIFDNHSTSADAYRAAEAMPLLYAPQRMADGDLYTTGATHDPTGLQAIWLKHRDLDAVIMLDPMARAIWREPTNIYDAFQLMLMNPIIALQVLISTLYAKTERLAEAMRRQRPPVRGPQVRRPQVQLPKLYYVPFDIDKNYYPSMLKWSHANAVVLEKIGRDAAIAFAAASRGNRQAFEDKYRYCNYVERQPRLNDFARPFARLFEQIEDGRDG